MFNKHLVYIILYFSFFSCSRSSEVDLDKGEVNGEKELGYTIPKDSLSDPVTISATKSLKTKFDKRKLVVIPFSFSKTDSIIPKITVVENPWIVEIGEDSLSLPEIVPVKDSSYLSGVPQITIAKDMYYKDVNAYSIYSFSKLQGLKYSGTRSLLEDRNGNVWFGSNGGGVTKFDGKYFTNYSEKQGLLSNKVTDMLQDHKGNIWFATEKGLCCFDGKNFTQFTGKDCIANQVVMRVFEDSKGNIWFSTFEGLCMYNGNVKDSREAGKVTKSKNQAESDSLVKIESSKFVIFTSKTGTLNDYITCFYEDFLGNIWFGSPSGVTCYNEKTFRHYTESNGLTNNLVTSICEDKKGNLWFGTIGGGISRFDGNRVEAIQNGNKRNFDQVDLMKVDGRLVTTFANYTQTEGLVHNNVFCIRNDKSGNLWIGTQFGGVSKFDGKSFSNLTENEGLPHNRVFEIIEDKFGNIWFGTESGVAKLLRESFLHFGKNDQLSNYKIRTIFEDNTGNLWIGTMSNGVLKYDGKTLTNYTEKEGLCNNKVFQIFQDKKGMMWFATYGGGISCLSDEEFTNYSVTEGLPSKYVTSIIEDKKGNLWLSTQSGGVSRFDGNKFVNYSKKSGLAANDARCIHEDRSGILWIGTVNGITKFDGKTFINYTTNDGLPVNPIMCMYEDTYGHMWFGTDEGGVSFFNGKKFVNFSEREGLAHHVVTNITEDKFRNVWFVTRFGLSRLTHDQIDKLSNAKKVEEDSKFQPTFFNYNFNDGFIGVGCEPFGSLLTKDGKLWFCSFDRLSVFQPQVNPVDTVPPNIRLAGVDLYNENISWSALEKNKDSVYILTNGVEIKNFEFDSISNWYNAPVNLSLAYNNNFLNFNIIGITMDQPQRVKYQYKLLGLENNWGPITERTNSSYGNLPAGSYTFVVKSLNSKGYWSKELQYKFTIRPPWWKTLLFRIILIGLIISGIVSYIKWREQKLKKHQRELEHKINEATFEITEQKQIIELKHQEIKDSINYAERIQRSFLATKEILDHNLKDYFVFFQPKDIVSGDFYWASSLVNGSFVYVVADSTGHGVPGAIMSVLNISSLEKSIETETDPSKIMNTTRQIIIDRLKRDGSEEGGKDGMDCSLIVLNKTRSKLMYSAANNPIWIVRNNEIIELKPDKMPVGKHDKDNMSFSQNEIDLQKGDVIYSLTDGFPDQFGGARGKKYMYKKLKEVLLSNSHLPMPEQRNKLEEEFRAWKGNLEQVDDVTIMGIRI